MPKQKQLNNQTKGEKAMTKKKDFDYRMYEPKWYDHLLNSLFMIMVIVFMVFFFGFIIYSAYQIATNPNHPVNVRNHTNSYALESCYQINDDLVLIVKEQKKYINWLESVVVELDPFEYNK